ncbi:hypothetical protein AB4099_32580 [Bosea sp. 2KB_26]|uniref:hypothetical protein n=1 Tax=Bosea sp. 2KB_26 TaxID=3237475 RepID=UPI003F92229C
MAMPFRTMVATPEEIARMAEAFDEAWSQIQTRVDTSSASRHRDRLACIIAELWLADPSADLALLAVRRFEKIVAGAPLGMPTARLKAVE